MSIDVSVIIPTFRRPELLVRCLDALSSQSISGSRWEIIVADDADDDGTKRLLSCVERRNVECHGPSIVYAPVRQSHGPAAARNAASKLAQGRVLAFTDDDTLPDADWLAAGLAAIEQGADAVAGQIVVPLSGARPTDYERDASRLADAEFVTANCFVRSEVFRAVDGFDERFTSAWREDSDLHFRLLDHGYVVAKAPDALVVHPVRPGRWAVSLFQQRKSSFNALLYKKHPRRYREHIQRRPPIAYYAATFGLIGAIGAHGRNRTVSLLSALAWSGLTVRFLLLRLRGTSLAPSHIAEMVVTSALIPPVAIYWRLWGSVRHRAVFI